MKDPILSDSGALLTPERLKSIAIFAFKSLVVADHGSFPSKRLSDREPFFTKDARYAFRESHTIPSNVQMWIAAFKEGSHGVFRAIYYPSPANVQPGFEIYVLTFGAGFLLFQVVASRWLGVGIPKLRPGVTQGPWWDKYSIPFWPSDGHSILWPPNRQLHLRWAAMYTTRWKGTDIPADWVKLKWACKRALRICHFCWRQVRGVSTTMWVPDKERTQRQCIDSPL